MQTNLGSTQKFFNTKTNSRQKVNIYYIVHIQLKVASDCFSCTKYRGPIEKLKIKYTKYAEIQEPGDLVCKLQLQ